MIPVFKPFINADTMKASVDALHLGWLGMGSYVRDFEIALAAALELPEDRTVVAVNTCTSAIHLALLSAGVAPGDEVITPSLNNIGDFQAIGMCGARPVFVDVSEHDLALDPTKVAAAIGPKTKAIIPLHYMGIPCAIDAIYEVARAHGVPVVEDAAHATVSRTKSRVIGSFGDYACFSFDAIKTVTCIDGGAVVLPRDKAAELYPRRLLGMTQSNDRLYSNARAYEFDVLAQGFRYHLANLHAAIGLSQLKALPMFIANRRKYARLYNEAFTGLAGIIVPQSDFDDVSLFHYVLRVTGGKRDAFRQHLRDRGVDTGVHWLPGHWFTWLKNCRGADFLPVTDRIGAEMVTLPLWSSMDENSLSAVIDAVRSFAHAAGKGVAMTVHDAAAVDRLRSWKTEGARTIRVEGHDGIVLRPIDTSRPSDEDVALLTSARNSTARSFLTEFDATAPRTRGWLRENVRYDDSRILFIIEDAAAGLRLGYIGIASIDWKARTAEADSVVRAVEGRKGLMTAALRSLLTWATRELGLSEIFVRVLADNPALAFYEKFGFRELRRTKLMSEATDDAVVWHEVHDVSAVPPGAEVRELVHMRLAEPSSTTEGPRS